MRLYLCWIVLAFGAWRAVAAESPEYYARDGVELEVSRGEGDRAFLTATRRAGTKPVEKLAVGVELAVRGEMASGPHWQLAFRKEEVEVTEHGGVSGNFARESEAERLAAAKAWAAAADAELNRVYGEARARLKPEAAGQLQEAQREWIHFTYEAPHEAAQEERAEYWYLRGDRAAQRVAFLASYRAGSGDPGLSAQLETAENESDWPAVAEITRRLLIDSPRNQELWIKQAQACAEARDWAHGRAVLDAWAKAVPQPAPDLVKLRGDMLEGQEDHEGAVKAWIAYLAAAPKEKQVRDQLAEKLIRMGRDQEAAAILEQRIKLEPTAAAWMNLAIVDAHLHDWKKMSASARRANELDATADAVKANLPRVERLEKRLGELARLDAGVNGLLERALVFLETDWPEMALPDAEAALKLSPDSARAAITKAAALKALGRSDEAEPLRVDLSTAKLTSPEVLRRIGSADAVLAKAGPTYDALIGRAVSLALADQYALMEQDASAALGQVALETADRREPESAMAHSLYGISLAARKKPWFALHELRRANELDPKIAEAWLKRGEIEGELHRPALAVEAFTKVLELHPGNLHTLQLREKYLRLLGRNAEADADAAQLKAGGVK